MLPCSFYLYGVYGLTATTTLTTYLAMSTTDTTTRNGLSILSAITGSVAVGYAGIYLARLCGGD
jgi:hypothetical protein